MKGNWLLPESLADVLPAEARHIEVLRRSLLDLFRNYGFELVTPPLVEYIESLLCGTGSDLSLRTSKLVDQLSGKPPAQRQKRNPGTRPAGLLSSRELLQIGAEIYGHAGIDADLEIIRLALESIRIAGVKDMRLDLCHAGLVRSIIESDPAARLRADEIMVLLRDKDLPGIALLGAGPDALAPVTVGALAQLPLLYDGAAVIGRARKQLPALPGVAGALDTLESLLADLDDVSVGIDLADVGSYGYHTGVTFSIYAEGWHDVLVQGGRYDDVGRGFGRGRPATGFSLDLRKLAGGLAPAAAVPAIRSPAAHDPALRDAVQSLRREGHIVVQVFPGETATHDEFVFDRELVLEKGRWVVRTVA